MLPGVTARPLAGSPRRRLQGQVRSAEARLREEPAMNEAQQPVTACLIIIGTEILSGRTVDANLPYIARKLGEVRIRMAEARVVPDDEAAIAAAVNACR